MKKGLVTAFVIASVLAFNACKKEEGPVGPIGPTGATGATGAPGAQGPVGATGVAGKDGTVIRSGEGAPQSSLGAEGDYYFDRTNKSLYGPKTDQGWGDGISLQGAAGADGAPGADGATGATGADGATGATGADGAPGADGATGATGATGADGTNGTNFIAGSGAPTGGAEGDWYFDIESSTFYGPRSATGWDSGNQIPLGSAFGARTYHIIRGFEDVKQTYLEYAHVLEYDYSDYSLFSSYEVLPQDLVRINNHDNWHENREMIFESVPNSGVFHMVPRGAFDFAGSGVPAPAGLFPAPYNITVGANFKYTTNSNPNNTFTLTAEDISRLSVNNGNAFTYLTYAATKREDIQVGELLTFFQKRKVTRVNSDDTYYAEYSAETNLDLNAIAPELERWKQDGAYVFLGYNYYANKAGANQLKRYTGPDHYRGYVNLTDHLNSYVVGGVGYGEKDEDGVYPFTSIAINNTTNPFNAGNSGAWANYRNGSAPYTTHAALNTGIAGNLGQSNVTLAPNQVASPVSGTYSYENGKFHVTWDITSGQDVNGPISISPLTLTNPSNLAMEDLLLNPTWLVRSHNQEYYTAPRLEIATGTPTPVNGITGSFVWRPGFWTTVFGFTVWVPSGYQPVLGATTAIPNSRLNSGGQPAKYFSDHNLVKVTLNVVPAEIVKNAKAAGIDVNNPEALINFANSLQLQ